jgi:hypothetical protein
MIIVFGNTPENILKKLSRMIWNNLAKYKKVYQ